MSDTPRMKAAQMTAIEHMTGDVYRVGCDIELELNASNAEIEEKRKDIVYLATEKAKLEERIKRLEEDSQRLNWLLNRGLAWRDCYNDWWKAGEWLYASQSALETIDKAKEAK